MNILIIDGQGGRIGCQLIEMIKARLPGADITAVGTNSIATSAMIKAGPNRAATGENAVIAASRKADAIVGPVGAAVADSMVGEVSPAMAAAVGQSAACKVLIPTNKCDILIAGVNDAPLSQLLDDAVNKVCKLFM